MALSEISPEAAMACCKSVVNVAIPQRRGSELPMNATRRVGINRPPEGQSWTVASCAHGFLRLYTDGGCCLCASVHSLSLSSYDSVLPWFQATFVLSILIMS